MPNLQDFIDPNQRYKPAARAALIEFVRSKPWKGDPMERGDKFAELHRKLCAAYSVEFLLLREDSDPLAPSSFHVDDAGHRLILAGKCSVLTYLFAFAKCRGFDSEQTAKWAVTTFARFFPKSFEKCEIVNGRVQQRA